MKVSHYAPRRLKTRRPVVASESSKAGKGSFRDGVDRVLFSIDYPYSTNRTGRDFLDTLKLPAADLEKFAHGNADRLLKLPPKR